MKCCSYIVETKFCPLCGRQVTDPASTLVIHLRSRAESCRGAVDRLEERWGHRGTNEQSRSAFRNREAIAVKWEEWLTLVTSLIERNAR